MRILRPWLACGLLLFAAACTPARPTLPSGGGTSFPAFAEAYTEAVESCRDVRTVGAVLGLSGRAGGTRLRGRIAAGLAAPSSIRLEGIAPFGSPVFILAGRDDEATLLLPRDRLVVRDEAPEAIVEALAGVPLTPAELRAAIAGCGLGVHQPTDGRSFGAEWVAVDAGDTLTYLRRVENRWRVAAAVRQPVTLLYDEFVAGRPRRIFIRAATPGASSLAADIALEARDVTLNGTIPDEAFAVQVPPGTDPLSLEELRRAGPLGERR